MNMTHSNHQSLTAEQREKLHDCAHVRIGGECYYFPDYERLTYAIKWRDIDPKPLEKLEIEKAKELFGECTMIQVAMIKRDFLRAAIMQRTCGEHELNLDVPPSLSKDFKAFINNFRSNQEQYLLELCNELKKIEEDEEDIFDTFVDKFSDLIEQHYNKDNRDFLVQRTFDLIKSRAFKTYTATIGMSKVGNGKVESVHVPTPGNWEGQTLEDKPKSFQEAIGLGVGICLQIRRDHVVILPKPKTETVVQATDMAGIKM